MLSTLDVVESDVLPMFNDAAREMLKSFDGDSIAALSKTLAFISGHHKKDSSKAKHGGGGYDNDFDGDGGYGGRSS